MALTLCTMCERHVRESEARCPFCDAPVRADPSRRGEVRQAVTRAIAFAAVALMGCQEEKKPEPPAAPVATPVTTKAPVEAAPVVVDASVPEAAIAAPEEAGTHDAVPVVDAKPVVKVKPPPPPPNLAKPYGAPPADGLLV